MNLEIREMLPEEQNYTYTQSVQIMAQTGCIGHLRGDMDTNGTGFFTGWDDHQRHLKTDAFKTEFDQVIHSLRFESGILKNRSELAKYCYDHPQSRMSGGRSYGLRVNTVQYAYMCRLNPNKGEYNFYIYAYRKDWLDSHLQEARKGIRFIDSHYNELFRIPDGGAICITSSTGLKKTAICRYIDDYHLEVDRRIYHICEFAEWMEKIDAKVEPANSDVQPSKRKEARHAGISR